MTFTLTSGATAVVDTRGGELVSYVKDGIEYVWQGDPAHWSGQAPILFPVCCAAKDNKIAFDGVEYPMPKHGFVRRNGFEPVTIGKDRVVIEQRETEATLKMFPFCYSLRVEYAITDEGFSATFTVKNLDKNEMTYCIGGHPAFNCPMTPEDGGFEDYSLFFEETEGCTASLTKDGYMNAEIPKLDLLKGTTEMPLRWSDFDNDAIILEYLPKKTVKLLSRKTEKGIRFDFDGFSALGLWTPDHKHSPFICLEPWNGLPADVAETVDAKSKKYCRTLQPDEEHSVGYQVTVIR